MRPAFVPLPVLAVILFLLIRAEILHRRRQIYVLKPIATLLVITVALLSFLEPRQNLTYTVGVLIGLLFSFGGDMALMFQEHRKPFVIGLILFLLAHIVYAVVFTLLGRFSALDLLSGFVLLVVGVGFYALIQANLGSMRIPVILYIVVISIMVHRAVSTFANPAIDTGQALTITAGAIVFYISDVILAASRFWRSWRYHRISLAFYYTGQTLIALAASTFGG